MARIYLGLAEVQKGNIDGAVAALQEAKLVFSQTENDVWRVPVRLVFADRGEGV